MASFHQFYKKSVPERLRALSESGLLSESQYEDLLAGRLTLPQDSANHMVENYIHNYDLPMGLAFHYLINEKDYIVPMAVEEPSVIAAASNGAKIIKKSGGFHSQAQNRQMIGQVAIMHSTDLDGDRDRILSQKEHLLSVANQAYPSIVKRGGGARDIQVRIIAGDPGENIESYLVLHLHLDSQEAMGANMLNTMLEAIAPEVEKLTSGQVLMSILSNLATQSLVTVTCEVKPALLARDNLSGERVRDLIVEASDFAYVDPYRATTHNKGVMNGIDAVVIASGNDWRAIEAGAHAYAARSGQYRSMTRWRKNDSGNLTGNITLPLPVATVGGSISYHPGAKLTHTILGNPSAIELAQIIASVGLAQNFSAILALVTSGIQKGHMALQAKSLAINAGASGDLINQVTQKLIESDQMNLATAQAILASLKNKTN